MSFECSNAIHLMRKDLYTYSNSTILFVRKQIVLNNNARRFQPKSRNNVHIQIITIQTLLDTFLQVLRNALV